MPPICVTPATFLVAEGLKRLPVKQPGVAKGHGLPVLHQHHVFPVQGILEAVGLELSVAAQGRWCRQRAASSNSFCFSTVNKPHLWNHFAHEGQWCGGGWATQIAS